jgi:hypothetical protein
MDTAIQYAMNDAPAPAYRAPELPERSLSSGGRDRQRTVAKHHIASARNGPPAMVNTTLSGNREKLAANVVASAKAKNEIDPPIYSNIVYSSIWTYPVRAPLIQEWLTCHACSNQRVGARNRKPTNGHCSVDSVGHSNPNRCTLAERRFQSSVASSVKPSSRFSFEPARRELASSQCFGKALGRSAILASIRGGRRRWSGLGVVGIDAEHQALRRRRVAVGRPAGAREQPRERIDLARLGIAASALRHASWANSGSIPPSPPGDTARWPSPRPRSTTSPRPRSASAGQVTSRQRANPSRHAAAKLAALAGLVPMTEVRGGWGDRTPGPRLAKPMLSR